jgi:hypothetical protein
LLNYGWALNYPKTALQKGNSRADRGLCQFFLI